MMNSEMHLVDVAPFVFRFRACQQMRMPGYMGSAWRGGFGRALRRAACITGLPVCPGCRFQARCVYPYIFETPGSADGGILADYERVPNPFVLAPPWGDAGTLAEGGEATLRLVLIGRAVEHSALARQAIAEAGLKGLGPDRGALDLVSVEPIAPPAPEPCPDRVAIELESPLRLVENGRLIGPAELRPRHLLLSLLRRVSLLAQLHGPAALHLDYRALKALAEGAEFADAQLRWAEWRRWSGRQQRLIPMGGLLGALSLPLQGLEPFWPFLALAPWVHTGKGATMGLGALRVAAA
jgi:CRISPR-associated endoribonuclease Cas6